MLDPSQFLTVLLTLGVALALGWLLAPHVTKIFTFAPSRLDRFLVPIETRIYRILGVDPARGMSWKQYFVSAVTVNVFQMLIAFLIFVFQNFLPLNPQGYAGLSLDLAFMQVISFATNTNLQHYNGEGVCNSLPNCSTQSPLGKYVTPGLSYLSQMSAVQFLQFTSAATGICVAVAMVRGFRPGAQDLGNFYADFVRSLTRLLIPFCFVASLVLVGLGIPQTLGGYRVVQTVEGATQTILVGPVASLVSIMQLGTNGGGYFGANSAYPFQNPNPASNIFEILLMLLLPTTLCFVYGHLLGSRREARPIVIASYLLFVFDLFIAFFPNPPSIGSGMEVRFGGFMSVFWTVVTTAVTTGSVNASLSAIHPLGILAAFFGMLIQATPGGKGVGLMYMIMYVVITVFIVGLMSGRTPEYLGLKLTARDVKIVMVAFLLHPVIILVPTIIAYASGAVNSIGLNSSSTGFTSVLYEFTTAASNNGSSFLGATGNTPFFNISTAVVMVLGRYAPIALLLALSSSMINRKRRPSTGLRTDSILFSIVLVGSIIILVVLTFFPFLALGPILEFFQGRGNGF